jgi:hypothetical protein
MTNTLRMAPIHGTVDLSQAAVLFPSMVRKNIPILTSTIVGPDDVSR